MRGNAEAHELVSATSLDKVLAQLATAPGQWTALAGGTELMVAHAAGRLNALRLISIWGLPELSAITVTENEILLGGGVTFDAVRRHDLITREFPLLARAASWIGSIANQSRATIAGNIVNGSPAADAPPALLVYDAEIELISQRGKRRLPYAQFHLGYKRNVLEADELVSGLYLPRRFTGHRQYLRKVGARRAMAITKVALAGTAVVDEGRILEIRLAAASVADRPVRLLATEAALSAQRLDAAIRAAACAALREEMRPIDDIRSSAGYRRQVAVNLLNEFLDQLEMSADETRGTRLNGVLDAWNAMDADAASAAMMACCSAQRWAAAVVAQRPYRDEATLFEKADEIWGGMGEQDWMEAFRSHPRIGERKAIHASDKSIAWSEQEQSSVEQAHADTLSQLAAGNVRYEELFGFTYIICATGKNAGEMLAILNHRLASDRQKELREAAGQQRQIMQIRLRKWLRI